MLVSHSKHFNHLYTDVLAAPEVNHEGQWIRVVHSRACRWKAHSIAGPGRPPPSAAPIAAVIPARSQDRCGSPILSIDCDSLSSRHVEGYRRPSSPRRREASGRGSPVVRFATFIMTSRRGRPHASSHPSSSLLPRGPRIPAPRWDRSAGAALLRLIHYS